MESFTPKFLITKLKLSCFLMTLQEIRRKKSEKEPPNFPEISFSWHGNNFLCFSPYPKEVTSVSGLSPSPSRQGM
jgi:hypothetical protein